MKIKDKGAFFAKRDGISFVIYIKNNYLLKKHPELNPKELEPNKIFSVYFENGIDYIGHNITLTKFKKQLKDVYDYDDYTSKEMYNLLKDSKSKTNFKITQKWVDNQYNFIKKQLNKH
jgi:hypothetical protein